MESDGDGDAAFASSQEVAADTESDAGGGGGSGGGRRAKPKGKPKGKRGGKSEEVKKKIEKSPKRIKDCLVPGCPDPRYRKLRFCLTHRASVDNMREHATMAKDPWWLNDTGVTYL